MKNVITYGTYDLLHQGHVNLLSRAKALGDYLIVGVTNDSFDRDRGKLNVRNNVLERVEAVKATGYADQVIIEDYIGQKIDFDHDTFVRQLEELRLLADDCTGNFAEIEQKVMEIVPTFKRSPLSCVHYDVPVNGVPAL